MKHRKGASLRELYLLGRDSLKKSGIENPELETSILLSRALGISKTDIYVHPEKELGSDKIEMFNRLLERRLNREPIAYILEEKEFYSRSFMVTPDVLIPRPETEILAEEALRIMEGIGSHLQIADVGTGSGCIAVTIACEHKDARIFATDISLDALMVAKTNAERHRASSRISFICADTLSCFKQGSLDLVVSNPPYVPATDFAGLEPEVRDFEPKVSLFGGEDGLNSVRKIILHATRVLKIDGWCILEIGIGQAEKVIEVFDGVGFKSISIVKDLAGIERVVKGKWH